MGALPHCYGSLDDSYFSLDHIFGSVWLSTDGGDVVEGRRPTRYSKTLRPSLAHSTATRFGWVRCDPVGRPRRTRSNTGARLRRRARLPQPNTRSVGPAF